MDLHEGSGDKKPPEPLVLGIDLGGTKILTAVFDADGELLSRERSATPGEKGQAAVIQAIWQSAQKALEQAHIGSEQLAAIGVGAPGPSNPHTGVLYASPNLPHWKHTPLKEILEKKFGRQTFLVNDANAAALAEYKYGAGRGACCFIYVTISTGIGGGMVIDGEIYSGAIGTAMEIGHMTVDQTGPRCHCGNIGCWEALASGTAMAGEAQRRIEGGESSILLDLAEGELRQVTARTIKSGAEAGDDLAKKMVARTSHYLGIGFANLINLFNPDVIAIGGGVANMGDMLLQPAYQIAKQRAFPQAYDAVRFVPATLGRDSGVRGAAACALQGVQDALPLDSDRDPNRKHP
jgi:glucokinase